MTKAEIIIKDTHRGLWYENGVLSEILVAGRYKIPQARWYHVFNKPPQVEIVLVDMRERDLTIKGQEILTSDKVSIRVSIIVRYRVLDPETAVHAVDNYEDRIYTDVQLAARRSLASMTLEDIMTNRNQLSEDILEEVKETAEGYGVLIGRADVKDLIFPGNLQQIMNRVLESERLAEAKLIDARAKADVERIETEARIENTRNMGIATIEAKRQTAEAEAEAQRIRVEADVSELEQRAEAAEAYTQHPALLRLTELETLSDLSKIANARIYINFDGQTKMKEDDS